MTMAMKAREIRQKNNDSRITETLMSICENYIRLKDLDNSNKVLTEILESINDGDNDGLLDYYLLKYKICLLEDNFDEAENTLHVALNFAKNIDCLKQAGELSIMIGKYYIENKRDKEAALYLNEGVELFKKIGILKEA